MSVNFKNELANAGSGVKQSQLSLTLFSPLETFTICVFIAIKHNWTTATNWLLKIREGQEEEKIKEQSNSNTVIFESHRSFSAHFH